MRKSTLIGGLALAVMVALASPAAAAYEPVYDLAGGTMYVDTEAINADEYNPPFYQISAATFFVNKDGKETHRWVTFRYNRQKQTIYLKASDGKWYWLDAEENEISAKEIELAVLLFWHCYDEKF